MSKQQKLDSFFDRSNIRPVITPQSPCHQIPSTSSTKSPIPSTSSTKSPIPSTSSTKSAMPSTSSNKSSTKTINNKKKIDKRQQLFIKKAITFEEYKSFTNMSEILYKDNRKRYPEASYGKISRKVETQLVKFFKRLTEEYNFLSKYKVFFTDFHIEPKPWLTESDKLQLNKYKLKKLNVEMYKNNFMHDYNLLYIKLKNIKGNLTNLKLDIKAEKYFNKILKNKCNGNFSKTLKLCKKYYKMQTKNDHKNTNLKNYEHIIENTEEIYNSEEINSNENEKMNYCDNNESVFTSIDQVSYYDNKNDEKLNKKILKILDKPINTNQLNRIKIKFRQYALQAITVVGSKFFQHYRRKNYNLENVSKNTDLIEKSQHKSTGNKLQFNMEIEHNLTWHEFRERTNILDWVKNYIIKSEKDPEKYNVFLPHINRIAKKFYLTKYIKNMTLPPDLKMKQKNRMESGLTLSTSSCSSAETVIFKPNSAQKRNQKFLSIDKNSTYGKQFICDIQREKSLNYEPSPSTEQIRDKEQSLEVVNEFISSAEQIPDEEQSLQVVNEIISSPLHSNSEINIESEKLANYEPSAEQIPDEELSLQVVNEIISSPLHSNSEINIESEKLIDYEPSRSAEQIPDKEQSLEVVNKILSSPLYSDDSFLNICKRTKNRSLARKILADALNSQCPLNDNTLTLSANIEKSAEIILSNSEKNTQNIERDESEQVDSNLNEKSILQPTEEVEISLLQSSSDPLAFTITQNYVYYDCLSRGLNDENVPKKYSKINYNINDLNMKTELLNNSNYGDQVNDIFFSKNNDLVNNITESQSLIPKEVALIHEPDNINNKIYLQPRKRKHKEKSDKILKKSSVKENKNKNRDLLFKPIQWKCEPSSIELTYTNLSQINDRLNQLNTENHILSEENIISTHSNNSNIIPLNEEKENIMINELVNDNYKYNDIKIELNNFSQYSEDVEFIKNKTNEIIEIDDDFLSTEEMYHQMGNDETINKTGEEQQKSDYAATSYNNLSPITDRLNQHHIKNYNQNEEKAKTILETISSPNKLNAAVNEHHINHERLMEESINSNDSNINEDQENIIKKSLLNDHSYSRDIKIELNNVSQYSDDVEFIQNKSNEIIEIEDDLINTEEMYHEMGYDDPINNTVEKKDKSNGIAEMMIIEVNKIQYCQTKISSTATTNTNLSSTKNRLNQHHIKKSRSKNKHEKKSKAKSKTNPSTYKKLNPNEDFVPQSKNYFEPLELIFEVDPGASTTKSFKTTQINVIQPEPEQIQSAEDNNYDIEDFSQIIEESEQNSPDPNIKQLTRISNSAVEHSNPTVSQLLNLDTTFLISSQLIKSLPLTTNEESPSLECDVAVTISYPRINNMALIPPAQLQSDSYEYLFLTKVYFNVNGYNMKCNNKLSVLETDDTITAIVQLSRNTNKTDVLKGKNIQFKLGINNQNWSDIKNVLFIIEKFIYNCYESPSDKSLLNLILYYFFKTLPKFSKITQSSSSNYNNKFSNTYKQPINSLSKVLDTRILNEMVNKNREIIE